MKHTHEPTPPLFLPPVDPNVQPTDVRRLTGQNADLLAWLQAGERVTPRSAYERGVTRLAARVHDLRSAGYAVKSDYDAGSKCSVYWMEVGR